MSRSLCRRNVCAAVLATAAACLLAGCYFVSYEDASKDPRYSHFVGSHYRSTERLAIHGITMERDYSPVLDHYTVTDLPGFGGREVLSKKTLHSGTTVKVLRVLRCTDCFLDTPFGGRVEVVVEVTSSADYQNAPVKIDIRYLEGPEQAFTKVP